MNIDNEQKLFQLSTCIGAGLFSPDETMKLSLRKSESFDLNWIVKWEDGVEEYIGCHSEQLCEWLYPVAPVRSFAEYDEEFYPVLTELALRIFHHFRDVPIISISHCETLQLNQELDVILQLMDGAQRLNVTLIDWPMQRLLECTSGWSRTPEESTGLVLPLPVSISRLIMPLQSLLSLRPGDGIVLPTVSDVEKNMYWIFLDETKITMSELSEDGVVIDAVEHAIDDVLYERNTSHSTLGDVKVPVVAELGTVRLSVNELSNMSTGMVLSERIVFADKVKLTVNGSCIGYAQLIKATDNWILQISEIFTTGLAFPSVKTTNSTADTQG